MKSRIRFIPHPKDDQTQHFFFANESIKNKHTPVKLILRIAKIWLYSKGSL
jgi:hypothetical protein